MVCPDLPGGAALAREFVALNEFLVTGGDRPSALQRLVDLAVTGIDGCDWAAITEWPPGRNPRSLATSGEIAGLADRLQYDAGEGPCLSAAAASVVIVVSDLAGDSRWPTFARAVTERTPIRSAAAFHLLEEPVRCALNLYGRRVDAFDADAVSLAALFASSASAFLLHADSSAKAVNLAAALTTSRQIGIAVGILMNAHKVTADRAFDLLRATSQRLNRKVHDIAEEVGHTGALPTPPDA